MHTAIISGLFAFLGALVGIYFQKKNQQETWLLQRRADVFADFLRTLEQCHKDAIFHWHSDWQGLSGKEKTKIIVETYEPILINEKIVSLYLPNNLRPVFKDTVKNIMYVDDFEKKSIGQYIDEVEELFTKTLSRPSWY